jgi:hypothetical protein
LYKHRAWWSGHGSSTFRHGGGHGSPVSAFAGEKKLHSAVQNGAQFVCLFVFFEEKENEFGSDLKMGYETSNHPREGNIGVQ